MTFPKRRLAVWLFLCAAALAGPSALAQLAPSGEHYAGRPSDTGYGGTLVNATGSFAASIPFDWPPARGGLPIPLRIAYGGSGVGAAGLGWDLELSYIQQDRTFAHRRPAGVGDALPTPRSRTSITLLGQRMELIQDGNVWVARHGTLELSATESAGSWLAYDGNGRTYTFQRPPELGNAGVWLLHSISGAGGAVVQLRYEITTWPLDGGTGTAVDLILIEYNSGPGAACAKNEIALTYDNGSIQPLSMSVLGDRVLVRKRTLTSVDVKSRASCADAPQRLRRYAFEYAPDTDTLLPRLTAATVSGRQGTPEENLALPIARYGYGSATSNGALHYQRTQTINLPAGVNRISSTTLDSSVNAPGPGDRYAMWQTLTDVTGDGRPDLVFQKNDKLWVAYNRPGADGTTTLGVGNQQVVQLADTTFSNGAFATHTSAKRRFAYGPANRNTTNVWRQAIDINGDGRIDIIDAAEEPDHWVVYLNTPGGATDVKWERRSYGVESLRAALVSSGHLIDGPHVPLSRRATGTDLKVWECWQWNGSQWEWYSQGFSNHRCEGVEQQIAERGPERTIVEWELADLNGDGYPDFVFDSSPVDFQVNPPSITPTPVLGAVYPADFGIGGPIWHLFAPGAANQLRVSFNVVGVRFDTDSTAFAQSVDLRAPGAQLGVAVWNCRGGQLGFPCDDSVQIESAAFADVNGDGLLDRVVGTKAFLGAYHGTAVAFSKVYITLPGPLATQHNDHTQQCAAGGGHKPTATQPQGLRDLTGDGIPDYVDHGQVWIGTGTGFRPSIPITVAGASFQFSHQTESCDGKLSNTDGGLFDVDGDGKPEIIGLSGETFLISQLLTGTQVPGAPESGRLTDLDNGYGAKTKISYVSAKNFTDNPVPFPETVISSVLTTGALGLGGTVAEARYAYSKATLVFDSALDRFGSTGYQRFVMLRLLKNSEGRLQDLATITDTWPLTPFMPGMSQPARWVRTERVGHTRDVFRLRGGGNPNPWLLLDVDSNDARVIGVSHSEWDANMYQVAANPNDNPLDCLEMVDPLDYAYSLANIGAGIDTCRTRGFAFVSSQHSWYGGSPPPSDNNIQTQAKTLATDDYGRPVITEYDNDVFRSDDDVCLENTFAAAPNGTFPRVLNALASRRIYTCGKSEQNITVASEAWSHDNLPPGLVSSGFVTSHSVDRRATDTGVVLNTIRVFDTTYDAAGNPATTSTHRDGATRTTTFTYDPFGLVPTHIRLDATGALSSELVIEYDPISVAPVSSGIAGETQRGIDFDGFGRPIRSTVTPPGGSLGVLSTRSYLGFDSPDPNGRRISSTRFSTPVPPANVATTQGRSQTLFLDELGRERWTEVTLGSDYANAVVVAGWRQYDDGGRVAFRADPYVKGQDPATVYGTSYYFTSAGDMSCAIRGRGPQPFSMSSDMAAERFPTCARHSYPGHVETVDVWDAAALLAGSAQAGVVKRTVTTGAGRVIERSTLFAGVPLEDSTFGYDPLGQVTSMTRFLDPMHAAGPVRWSFQLDSTGQRLQSIEPDTSARFYTYSDWGEALETRWVDGGVERRLVRSYDALRRLVSSEERNNGITDPETVAKYAYDNAVHLSPLAVPTFVSGHLAQATSPGSDVAFSYDAFGRMNGEVFKSAQGELYVKKAEHDADGRLLSLTFHLPDQSYAKEVVQYSYDSAGRLRGATYSDSSGVFQLYKADEVDAFGRVRKAVMGGNTTFHAAYANDGRRLLTEAEIKSPLGSRRLTLDGVDPVGRELSRTEFQDGAATGVQTQFAYDRIGSLSHAAKTHGPTSVFDWHYRYDSLGNILALSDGSHMTTLQRSTSDPDRVCRIDYGNGGGGIACNVTYDGVGGIVEQATVNGSRKIRYFDDGKVREISEGSAKAQFRYDAFGRVEELNVTGTGVSNTRQVWRYGELLERQDQVSNGALTSFLSRSIPGPGGGAFASRRGINQDWVFAFGELRGNRFFINQNGAFVQDVDYLPFGEATSTGAAVGSSDYTSQQWNGGDALAAFNLSQLGARIYDPVIGRFLSRDGLMALRSATSSNPYAFAVNDPINFADPTGLCAGGIGQECLYLASINPLGLLGQAWNWLSSGSSGPAPQQAPAVSAGPQTPGGIELMRKSLDELGYAPKNINFDTLDATPMSMSAKLDRIKESPSAERNAAIDAYNAKWDRRANISRVVGWTLFTIGTGGAAASEMAGVYFASRGMLGAAQFFGGSVTGMAAGGGAVVGGTQLENDLEMEEEVLSADAAATTRFHYTDEAGHAGILETETLNPSLKALNPKDAWYGDGQYLSDIVPWTKTPAQLSREFLGLPYQGARFTHFVEIDVSGLNVVMGRPGVFVIPNSGPLDLTGRIISWGQVRP